MEHPFGYIKETKVYLKGFLGQPDRIIGEVKEDEASTLKYFEERFISVKEKVDNLKKDIEENQNKGSFLMKLIHLRDSLMQYDALGDFIPLIDELNHLEKYLEEIIKKNREKNLEIKKGLVLEAEALKNDTDWKKTTEEFKNQKLRWIKTGPVEKEYEEALETSFDGAVNTFFENRKQFFEGLALQAEENIKVYEALVRQAQDAFNMPDAKHAFEISKKIQKQWKESGKVPAEKRQPLWDEFSKLNNRIFSRFRRTMESGPQLNPREMLKKMEEMNSAMKKLSSQETSPQVLSLAKKLQAEWKALPPRKPKESNLIMRSFIFNTEIVFEKAFLDKLANSKNPDFREKTESEQNQIKTTIIKDLIFRDQNELDTVKENSEKFRTQEDDFETMLRRKLSAYKRKVDVKNSILKELSNK